MKDAWNRKDDDLHKENYALKGELDKLKTFQYYFEYMKKENSKHKNWLAEKELEFISMSIERKKAEIHALERVKELILNN